MEKAKKIQEVEQLTKAFSESTAVYCADYRGLSVAEISNLRAELSKAGATVRVAKNTLLRLAFKASADGVSAEEQNKFIALFKGPTFIAFANDDVVAPAKVFDKYGKDKGAFKPKGGWFDGTCINADGIEQVSKLPSREETLSTLLRLISTPATQLVRVLSAPAQQLVQVLGAYKDKLSN
jgi:large subunit ribosomal protein L10